MEPIPIFDPKETNRPMKVAAFMSGSGSNVVRLLDRQQDLQRKKGRPPFEVTLIFSDRSDGGSKGEAIALEYGLPYMSYDIRAFHRLRGLERTVSTPAGLAARKEYDKVAAAVLRAFEIDLVALGGYMSYITLSGCVNVHPADLSLRNPDGSRKYVGDRAVLDAILAGETELRSSTLWTDRGVDTGPLLMVSDPVPVRLPEPLDVLRKDPRRLRQAADEHQERLKETGDWKIFPLTVEMIAMGRFALDDRGRVYVDGIHVPDGYRLS
ncbi:MAG: phosphoribosylglycinamide formyltransferase [Desulfobacteraceae bacterium]